MATEQTIKQIRDIVQSCMNSSVEDLTVRPEWGEINFSEAVPAITRARGMIAPLGLVPLELLPEGVAQTFIEPLKHLARSFQAIDEFKLTAGGDPIQRRNQLVQNLSTQADNIYPVITPHIPFLAYQRGDVERNIQALVARVGEADGLMATAQKEALERKTELDEIVRVTREAAAKAGVGVFTQDFAESAAKHSDNAVNWLWGTAAAAVATLAAAAYFTFFTHLPDDAKTPLIVHLTVSKILIVAILGTAAIWCGRLFKAAMHQAAVNTHRANALKTFQAFVQATQNDAVKDAVLLETTRSIFNIGSTGYLDGVGSEGNESPLKVVEMVKAFKD
ncbi:MAG: hypothetical protein LDL39_11500 [Magnetospirillum sp.]|nr:hypothetical protein [Magnetospirillum sp.]